MCCKGSGPWSKPASHFLDPKGKYDTFGKPGWFDNVKGEVEACTSGVAVADTSATLKIEISVSSLS